MDQDKKYKNICITLTASEYWHVVHNAQAEQRPVANYMYIHYIKPAIEKELNIKD